MVVGVLRLRLFMRQNRSLKDKRQVLRRIKDKVRNQFNASIAEVGDLDQWKSALLGVSVVSNDAHLVSSTLDKMINVIERLHVAEIVGRDRIVDHYNDQELLEP